MVGKNEREKKQVQQNRALTFKEKKTNAIENDVGGEMKEIDSD